MANPLLGLMACDSELLLDHAQGYAMLAQEEFQAQLEIFKRTVWLYSALLFCITTGATLTGVAFLIYISHGELASHTLVGMAGVVLVPFLGAAYFLSQVKSVPKRESLVRFQNQLKADLNAFKSGSAP